MNYNIQTYSNFSGSDYISPTISSVGNIIDSFLKLMTMREKAKSDIERQQIDLQIASLAQQSNMSFEELRRAAEKQKTQGMITLGLGIIGLLAIISITILIK